MTNTVRPPTNADEAAGMMREATEWMETWAPDVLRATMRATEYAKDAERYRFLRDAPATWAPFPVREWLWHRPFGSVGTLDGLIDEAMAAAPAVVKPNDGINRHCPVRSNDDN